MYQIVVEGTKKHLIIERKTLNSTIHNYWRMAGRHPGTRVFVYDLDLNQEVPQSLLDRIGIERGWVW